MLGHVVPASETDQHKLQQRKAGSEDRGAEKVGVVSAGRVPADRELLVVGGKMEVASDPQRYICACAWLVNYTHFLSILYIIMY